MVEIAPGDGDRVELLLLHDLRWESCISNEPGLSAKFRLSTEKPLSQRCFNRRRTVILSRVGEMSGHVLLVSHSFGVDSMLYEHDSDVIMRNSSCFGGSSYQLGGSIRIRM